MNAHVLQPTSEIKARLRVFTRADAARCGLSPRDLQAMITAGRVLRLGSRWFGDPSTPAYAVTALSAGYRLTCISALETHGLWVPDLWAARNHPHVAVRRPHRTLASLPRTRRIGVAHTVQAWPDPEPVLPLAVCLRHAARCLSADDLAVVLESAAERRVLGGSELTAILESLPQKTRRGVGPISGRSQSGTETKVRNYLRKLGVTVAEQPALLPDERMDLRVGERLVIECDSRSHHTDPAAFANDRRRDQQLLLRGYRVLRLTWEDVMLHWERTTFYLRQVIAGELHRAPRSQRAAPRVLVPHGSREG